MVQRHKVESSDISSIGYDADVRVLEVEFVSRAVYQYANVPENVYTELMQAGSKGQYFNKYIRDQYQSSKLST